jgi:DNA-binding transcriptional regulator YhcF (GntR family)
MSLRTLSISQIQGWLDIHRRRLRAGDNIPTVSEIASRAGLSRQTLYAVLNGERDEFGEVAQIRLSMVISQISSESCYQQSKMARIDLTGASPRIRFGM